MEKEKGEKTGQIFLPCLGEKPNSREASASAKLRSVQTQQHSTEQPL
jgi:hypothetical protein